MGTVLYRYDYAKFMITCEPDRWQSIYQGLTLLSHERKYDTEWLKSHKVNRLWYNADSGFETWSIDIWGSWAGIVEVMPRHWLEYLRRADVRATVWETSSEDVITVGQHLQRSVSSYNVNVFSTRPATKRLGRDRGGVGFAIGSHKSDLRVTVYKRTHEPVAQEFQLSGTMLRRLTGEVVEQTVLLGDAFSVWENLKAKMVVAGEKRMNRVFESCGLGTAYPLYSRVSELETPPMQDTFVTDEEEAYQVLWSDFTNPEPPNEE